MKFAQTPPSTPEHNPKTGSETQANAAKVPQEPNRASQAQSSIPLEGFDLNPNAVANMSCAEYFRRKGIEMPPIEFVAFPVAHAGVENANQIIAFMKKDKPDMFLKESVIHMPKGFDGIFRTAREAGQSIDFINDWIKEEREDVLGKDSSVLSFMGVLEKYCKDNNIILSSYEQKSYKADLDRIKLIREAIQKVSEKSDLKTFIEHEDFESALEVARLKIDEFDKVNQMRENSILSSFGPNIADEYRFNKSLHEKEKLKIVYFIGVGHFNGVIKKMQDRGDAVEILDKGKDFIEQVYNPDFIVFLGFLAWFIDEYRVNFDSVMKVLMTVDFQIIARKYGSNLIDFLVYAKRQPFPKKYFEENFAAEIEKIKNK